MRKHISCFIILVVAFTLNSCQKENRKAELFVLSTNNVEINGTTKNGIKLSALFLFETDEVILEQGFVYGLNTDPNLQDHVLKTKDLNASEFAMEIEDALIPDTTYHVRSFARSKKYFVYGNDVSFYSNGSEPPSIEKIEPQIAFWGDTIMIVGKNFDSKGKNNSVWFNEFEAKRKWGVKDTIYAIIPVELNSKKSDIRVQLYGKQSDNIKQFEILSPIVDNVSLFQGQYPDTITVKGNYFSDKFSSIFVGEESIQPISILKEEIKFQVPFLGDGQEIPINLKQLNETTSIVNQFKYNEQKITGISIDSIYITDTITIYSQNIDFRKIDIMLNVEGVIYQKEAIWQDSMRVHPKFNYANSTLSEFLVKSQIVLPFAQTKTIQTIIVPHKNPRIRKIYNSKLAYYEELFFAADGFYSFGANTAVFIENEDASQNDIQLSRYQHLGSQHMIKILIPKEIGPGKYKLYLKSCERFSSSVEFEVMKPVIHSISKSRASRMDEVEIIGEYLPTSPSLYTWHQLEENELVYKYNKVERYKVNPLILSMKELMGRGNYQLEINIGNTTYKSPQTIEIQDYFTFITSYKKDLFPYGDNYAFVTNNKLYSKTYNNSALSLDITTGIQKDLGINFFPYKWANPEYPIFYDKNVYSIFNGKLYQFDAENEKWEEEIFDFNNDTIRSCCVVNNKLQAFASSGRSYLKDTEWSTGPYIPALKGGLSRFSFSINDKIYFYLSYGLQSMSTISWGYEKEYPAPIYYSEGYKIPQHVFIKNNEIYLCYMKRGVYNTSILKFSPQNNTYTILNPETLPGYDYQIKFAPDEYENVYVIKGNYIYNFDPQ